MIVPIRLKTNAEEKGPVASVSSALARPRTKRLGAWTIAIKEREAIARLVYSATRLVSTLWATEATGPASIYKKISRVIDMQRYRKKNINSSPTAASRIELTTAAAQFSSAAALPIASDMSLSSATVSIATPVSSIPPCNNLLSSSQLVSATYMVSSAMLHGSTCVQTALTNSESPCC